MCFSKIFTYMLRQPGLTSYPIFELIKFFFVFLEQFISCCYGCRHGHLLITIFYGPKSLVMYIGIF